MGGLGSGRPNSGAPTCEGCLNIDLAWLRRRGMLQPGRRSAVTWSRSGEQTGSITLAAQTDGVRLIYRTTDRDGARLPQYRANLVMMRTAHRASAAFSSSSYCSRRRLYVAQRIRGGLGGKSYSSSVVPPHRSCKRLAILRARSKAR